MKYLEGFRDPAAARGLTAEIRRLAGLLAEKHQTLRIMEVCGTHTMAIARNGLRSLMPANVDLVSGPGCPVCVTPTGYVDAALELSRRGAWLVTFGDMLHVPGSDSTLAACRAAGGRVEVCYSPLLALEIAQQNPTQEVVFLAIGFETTTAPLVSLLAQAEADGVRNLSLLTAFKCVPPVLHAVLGDPDLGINALLCPAHVSAIIGADAYIPFAEKYEVPCVVAGFESLDILRSIVQLLEQADAGVARVENEYDRVVTPGGNRKAQELVAAWLEPEDACWRGLGVIPASGLQLRRERGSWDAARRFDITVGVGREPKGCLCGDVIKGLRKPPACPLFRKVCRPEAPVGPCMVSSEGACAAWYKYEQ